MNRNAKWLLSVFLIAGVLVWKKQHSSKTTPASDNSSAIVSEQASQAKPPAISGQQEEIAKASTAFPQKNQAEQASLQDMTKTLFQFTRPDSRLADLVQYLESSQQEPQIARNANPDTGEQVIVRTRSPLPGTRYFHAQYFSDENQQSFVQHMSFEFKPSETAMTSAIDAVQKSFPNLPAPHTQTTDFVQWNIDGYVLWVKKMNAADLQDDPFNAYEDNDVGTVRVAMEIEVHGKDDTHH